MALQSAVFTFALPEDIDTDNILIKSSTTKDGTYGVEATVSYEYGGTTHEFDSLDTTLWYKIQFRNTEDSENGPESDPVYGGDFAKSSPFLAISTLSDGANYATNEEVYEYSMLTPADVTSSRVGQALRRARAIVDLRTAELNLDRFTRTFDTDPARKKYNAVLRIIKEAEINLALSNIYKGLSDDVLMRDVRDTLAGIDTGFQAVSVGATNLSDGGGLSNTDHVGRLQLLGKSYALEGERLLEQIQSPSVRIHAQQNFNNRPSFRYPFNGF